MNNAINVGEHTLVVEKLYFATCFMQLHVLHVTFFCCIIYTLVVA
jgi:hypothetical protein